MGFVFLPRNLEMGGVLAGGCSSICGCAFVMCCSIWADHSCCCVILLYCSEGSLVLNGQPVIDGFCQLIEIVVDWKTWWSIVEIRPCTAAIVIMPKRSNHYLDVTEMGLRLYLHWLLYVHCYRSGHLLSLEAVQGKKSCLSMYCGLESIHNQGDPCRFVRDWFADIIHAREKNIGHGRC